MQGRRGFAVIRFSILLLSTSSVGYIARESIVHFSSELINLHLLLLTFYVGRKAKKASFHFVCYGTH